MQFADNKGPDQPVQMHRLIWAFVVCLQNEYTVVYVDEPKVSRSGCMGAHAHLDICYLHMA